MRTTSKTWLPPGGDAFDAWIEYDGGIGDPVIAGTPLYALAKDGNSGPIWYLWEVSDWDGRMEIRYENLWPGKGSISHVVIFGPATGGGTSSVPESGATVALSPSTNASIVSLATKR